MLLKYKVFWHTLTFSFENPTIVIIGELRRSRKTRFFIGTCVHYISIKAQLKDGKLFIFIIITLT